MNFSHINALISIVLRIQYGYVLYPTYEKELDNECLYCFFVVIFTVRTPLRRIAFLRIKETFFFNAVIFNAERFMR